jgi:hypothetical protein
VDFLNASDPEPSKAISNQDVPHRDVVGRDRHGRAHGNVRNGHRRTWNDALAGIANRSGDGAACLLRTGGSRERDHQHRAGRKSPRQGSNVVSAPPCQPHHFTLLTTGRSHNGNRRRGIYGQT